MKIVSRLFLIALVIAGLWLAMQSLVAKKERDLAASGSQPQPLSTVEVEGVRREQWQQYLYTIGTFTAVNDVSVTTEIDGKVTAIHFDSGQKVEAGTVLVTLDTSVDRAELDALRAEQRLNELQFERAQRLFKEKTVSKAEFDIAAARRDEAVAMTRAKAASLDKKTIRAPFAGILGIRRVALGEYLDAGAEIVSLKSISPIYLDFGTPERYIGLVSPGLDLEAEVQAYPGEVFRGRLTAIEPGVDRATRNLYLRGEFPNESRKLKPGMFAEIRGILPSEESVLTVPETAVSYAPYGNSVFVVETVDGTPQVARRPIETGEVRDGRVAVLGGLTESESIVIAGHNKLRNGMAVRIEPAKTLSSAASGIDGAMR